jgi:hypothetical protein
MTLDTAISAINLQQWFSKLSYALMLLLIHNNTNLSLQLIQDMTLEQYPWPRRPPARCWRTPPRCAHQERQGGRHATIQDYVFCVIILFFFCFAIYVTRYPPTRRPISREDAHRMYPRYPRVFLYVIIYCPLPHQSLWERLGVSLSCTCAAFSSLC